LTLPLSEGSSNSLQCPMCQKGIDNWLFNGGMGGGKEKKEGQFNKS